MDNQDKSLLKDKDFLKKFAVGTFFSLVVLAAGVAFIFPTQAQENPQAGVFRRVAQILGIEESNLSEAFQEANIEMINEKVDDGEITQERADEMIERIENGDFYRGGFEGRGHHRHGMIEIEEALGMDREELRIEFKAGKTIADIATEKGISTENLKSQIIEDMTEHAQQAFDEGRIDEERKDEMISEASDRAEEMLNSTHEQRGERMMGGRMGV